MALQLTTSNALKYDGAGTFKLERLKTDGTPSALPEDIYTAGQNLIGVINAAWSLTTEELRDENNQDPRAVYNTGTQETIGIEMRSDDPYLDLYLKGGTLTHAPGVQEVLDIPVTIPDLGKYAIKDPAGAAAKLDESVPILVRDAVTGEDYKRINEPPNGTPLTGEFKVDVATGEITFAVADKGKQVYVSAGFKVTDMTTFSRDRNASLSSYRLTLSGKIMQYDQTGKQWSNEIYPSVQLASGELASMARQLSPASTRTLNFQRVASKGSQGSTRRISAIPVDMI